MARKKIWLGLPALPRVSIFRATKDQTAELLKILRRVALANRRKEAQPFYPLRQIAKRFRVPISTVVRVYDHLENEGLLNRIRGSKTVLEGRAHARRLMVRGFIAMPVSLSYFVTLQDYRMFVMQMRREFWMRGFVTTKLFFEADERNPDVLVERIRDHDVDTVLWYLPEGLAKDTILRLRDMGIRVIAVSDGGLSTTRCQYEIHREAAVRAILDDWQRHDIKSVRIVRGDKKSVLDDARLGLLLDEKTIAFEPLRADLESLANFLQLAGDSAAIGVILPSSAASMLAFRAPDLLLRLLETCRVAFVGGPVSTPFAETPNAKADLVRVDWPVVAEQIVSDLIARKFDPVGSKIFEAKPYLQVPLRDYAQRI